MGRACGNIGNAHYSLCDYKQALVYHKKLLAIAEKLVDRRGMGVAYGNMGNAYQSLGEYQQAKDHYKQALTISKETGYGELEKLTEKKLGELEAKQQKEADNNQWCSIV